MVILFILIIIFISFYYYRRNKIITFLNNKAITVWFLLFRKCVKEKAAEPLHDWDIVQYLTSKEIFTMSVDQYLSRYWFMYYSGNKIHTRKETV